MSWNQVGRDLDFVERFLTDPKLPDDYILTSVTDENEATIVGIMARAFQAVDPEFMGNARTRADAREQQAERTLGHLSEIDEDWGWQFIQSKSSSDIGSSTGSISNVSAVSDSEARRLRRLLLKLGDLETFLAETLDDKVPYQKLCEVFGVQHEGRDEDECYRLLKEAILNYLKEKGAKVPGRSLPE